jgi:hypothetical protein
MHQLRPSLTALEWSRVGAQAKPNSRPDAVVRGRAVARVRLVEKIEISRETLGEADRSSWQDRNILRDLEAGPSSQFRARPVLTHLAVSGDLRRGRCGRRCAVRRTASTADWEISPAGGSPSDSEDLWSEPCQDLSFTTEEVNGAFEEAAVGNVGRQQTSSLKPSPAAFSVRPCQPSSITTEGVTMPSLGGWYGPRQ